MTSITIEPWMWPAALGLLGAVFGSFIATVAVRWPAGRGVSKGRSECDSCGKALRAPELVPLLSYVAQAGKCRGCGARIAMSHPLTELIGLAIGVLAGFVAPGWDGVTGAVFGWLLLALAALDLAALWLPNALNAALAVAGVAAGLAGSAPALGERLIGGIAGYGVLWAVAAGYKALRGRQGLGGGDPKLFGAIGLWLGWQALPTVLLAACLIGLTLVLGLVMAGRRIAATDRLPFGVLLAVAAWAVWLGTALGPQAVIPVDANAAIPVQTGR